jgi:uncharacterized membrane protein YqjE
VTLRNSLVNLAGDVVALLRTRFELVAVEFAQERARFFVLLTWSLAAFLLLLMAILTFSFGVAALFWDTPYRYAAFGVMAAVYFLCGLVLLFKVRNEVTNGAMPFEASVEVLSRDARLFESSRVETKEIETDR